MAKAFNHVPLSTFDEFDIEQVSQYPRNGLDSLDDDENYFFRDQLRYVIPEMTEFEYGRINARLVLPIDRRAGPGAEVIAFRQVTRTAVADVVSDYGNIIPLSNVFSEEFRGNVRSIAAAAEWSVQEIRAAAMANMPLDKDKAIAAREAMLRKENDIAWNGDPLNGLVGLLTDPNVPQNAVPNGGGGNPQWSTKTGAEMVADMNLIVNEIAENTGDVEAANTLLLPVAQYNLAATTRMETGTDTTALLFFVRNSPYINSIEDVVSVNELAGAGAGGVDVMIAYDKNSSKLQLNIPLDIEQFAPQIRDMTTKTIYHMRSGGVSVKKPLSINVGLDI